MNTHCGVYAITAPSGNCYIGSSVDIRDRWRQHRRHLAQLRHHSPRLQSAWAKHGEALSFKVLLICRREDLIFYEQRAIDALKPSLNVSKIAGSTLGQKHSVEARKKMSELAKGRLHSLETRMKMSAAHKGKVFTPETREKIGAAQRGKQRPPVSEKTRALLREKSTGKKLSPEARAKVSAARKGSKATKEARAKQSAVRRGKPLSAEHRQNISKGLRGNKNAAARAPAVV